MKPFNNQAEFNLHRQEERPYVPAPLSDTTLSLLITITPLVGNWTTVAMSTLFN